MGEFSEYQWDFHGDTTPRERLERVLEHYGVDAWTVDTAIRFVSDDDRVERDIERSIEGSDLRLERIRSIGDKTRYRIVL